MLSDAILDSCEELQYLSLVPQMLVSYPMLLRVALTVHVSSSLEPLIGGGRNALLGCVITGVSAVVTLEQL